MDEDNLEQLSQKIEAFMDNGLIFLGIAFLIVGAYLSYPKVITVSSSPIEGALPIYCVSTEEKKISLTFDSAWGNEDLSEILKTLAEEEVLATFFFSGHFIDSYPEDIQKIAEAGHDIANHGYHHRMMSQMTKAEITKEILDAHNRLTQIIGRQPDLFRPPSGDYNDLVVASAKECGYYTIQWNVDSLDWKDYGTEDMLKRVTEHNNLSNGSILLFHTGTKYTKDALGPIIRKLKEMGYSFLPVSQLIYREEYYIDHTGRQILK